MFLHSTRVTRASKILKTVAAVPLLWALTATRADAQAPLPFVLPGILGQGDAVVTGFSGALAPFPPPVAPIDPLDETFIDPAGASMRIQRLQAVGPPVGQMISSPTVFFAPANQVGQVFPVALDDAAAPNIYLGATSAFGIQIVTPDSDGDGRPERVKTGQPGAEFMAGQWGAALGGTAGSIYRVDGTTGAITLFTTIGANAGPGLGDVVFDRASHQFFVSDLDTGLIYRLDWTGLLTDAFDHGIDGRPVMGLPPVPDDGSTMSIADPGFNSEDPATWGYTQHERSVHGMAMRGGRLFYAVREPLQIWSIGIRLDGTFADDPRWEVDVAGLASTNAVTDIAFDSAGRMILAQRGAQRGSYDYSAFAEPLLSSVVRYRREIPDDIATPGTWVPVADEYAIGFRPDGRNATGGIALGYAYDVNGYLRPNACGQFLWSTGDSLRDNPALAPQLAAGGPAIVHGLQGNGRDLVRPANDPPFNSYFSDYDGIFDDPAHQGHVGDVEMLPCPGYGYIPPYVPPPGFPPPPAHTFNLTLDKQAEPYTCVVGGLGWLCNYTVRITNTGTVAYWGPLTIHDWLPANPPGAVVTFAPPPWLCGLVGPSEYECTYPPVVLFPGDSLDLYVTVDLPAAVPPAKDACYLSNAAQIWWWPGYGDAIPGDDFAFDSAFIPAADCEPPPGGQTNLIIEKTAIPDVCTIVGTDWECQFLITVTNAGPGIYNGEIEVTDTLASATPITSFNPPWNCVPAGPTWVCTHPVDSLNPGDSRHLIIKTLVPIAAQEAAGKCTVENEARITRAPGGTPQNFNGGDDTANAEAKTPGANCEPLDGLTDLSVKKEAKGCYEGGGGEWLCLWTVTLTNEGLEPFFSPIKLIDTFSVAPLVPAPTFLPASWTCGPDGGGYACTLPATLLAPSASVLLQVAVTLPAGTDICEIRNEVHIAEPAAGSNQNQNGGNDTGADTNFIPSVACDPPAEKKSNLKIEKTPGVCALAPTGAPAVNCPFEIKVTNLGPEEFNGQVLIGDIVGIAAATATITPLDPTWTCASGGPAAACQRIGAFPAGAVATFTLDAVVPLDDLRANACQVPNMARLFLPPYGPNNFEFADDISNVTALAPPELCQTNLELTKTAAEACTQNDSAAWPWRCSYEVTVKNVGDIAVTGPITVADTIPVDPGVGVGWSHDPAVPVACDIADPGLNCTYSGDLAPGEQFKFGVDILLPESYAAPGACKIPNTAEITSPVGNDQNADPADDSDTVIGKIDMVPVESPLGNITVPCDPPSLSIAKVANPPQCTKTDFGWDCAFDITIGSLGPDPYLGPVQIDEIIPPGAILKSFSAPWSCAVAGSNAHCTYPSDVFAVGETIMLKIVITVPDSFARAGQCTITNEVHTSVHAEVLHSDVGAQYMATATAQIPAEFCGQPAVIDACPLVRKMPNGGCCPEGSRWNGRECSGGTTTPVCPPDSNGTPPNCTCKPGTVGTPGKCGPPTTRACPSPSLGIFPNCRCPDGWTGTPPNNCKPPVTRACPSPSIGIFPNCTCPSGWTGTPPNNCKPPVTRACPSPSIGIFPNCTCPSGWTGTPPNNCKPPVQRACPSPSLGIFPNCRCPSGWTGTPPNNCRPPVQACPKPSVGIFPNCACPRGWTGTPPNDCKPPVRACPSDSNGTFPNCTCKPGTTGTPGSCRPVIRLVPVNPLVPILRVCPSDSIGTPPNCQCKSGSTGTPGKCQQVPR